MPWLEQFVQRHTLLVHVPLAVAVMLPVALLAAQRPGRGIRPWWMVCRYLAWWSLLITFLAVPAGILLARRTGFLPPGGYLARLSTGANPVFRQHELLGLACIVLGLLTLRACYRSRQDHQGLGFPALLFGCLWCAAALGAAWNGLQLKGSTPSQPKVATSAPATPPPQIHASERALPTPVMNYAALEPIQAEYVRTAPHGQRWGRTWVSPVGADAYRKGEPLPPGTLVVLATVEDKWGRPGPDPGPLYALEIKPDGKPSLTYFQAKAPVSPLDPTGGAGRILWQGDHPSLTECLSCHAQGTAPAKDRSRIQAFRKPKPVEEAPTEQ